MSRNGTQLYELVTEYSDLGEHRTGTPVDQATIAWLSEHLRQSGALVEHQPFTFDRYEAEWEVLIDGESVQSIPLFYEGVGQVATDNPATLIWEPGLSNTGLDSIFGSFARQAISDGATAAVVATGGPSGLLHAVNRTPVPGSGLPTLLVPGAFGEQLGSADIQVEIDARIVPGESANVVGRYGEGEIEETVVITTPISGWFRCAGERGTGIAVALEAAEALALDFPVLFIGASGHELHHQGAQLAVRELRGRPRAIVHIGASVAAAEAPPIDGQATLTRSLTGRVSADPVNVERIAVALETVGIATVVPHPLHDPAEWQGESKNWVQFERPLLSLVGGFHLFHAPEDTPDRATTPELLESVSTAVTAAIRWLAK